jgi:hypothetical protein
MHGAYILYGAYADACKCSADQRDGAKSFVAYNSSTPGAACKIKTAAGPDAARYAEDTSIISPDRENLRSMSFQHGTSFLMPTCIRMNTVKFMFGAHFINSDFPNDIKVLSCMGACDL